jgi:hypothetical protein
LIGGFAFSEAQLYRFCDQALRQIPEQPRRSVTVASIFSKIRGAKHGTGLQAKDDARGGERDQAFGFGAPVNPQQAETPRVYPLRTLLS